MNSDDVINKIIDGAGFQLFASELDDENIHWQLSSLIREIKKEGTKIISLVGGAGSGKSTLARKIAGTLQDAAVISTDDFVLGSRAFRKKYLDREGNDPLQKYDFDLLRRKVERIKTLKSGEFECVPRYDEATGIAIHIKYDPQTGRIKSKEREPCARRIEKVEFLIVEGDFQVLEKPDRIVFFHVPDDVRLYNRVHRDLKERGGSTPENVTENFVLRHKIQHLPYTLSYATSADLIVTVSADAGEGGYKYRYSLWMSPKARF